MCSQIHGQQLNVLQDYKSNYVECNLCTKICCNIKLQYLTLILLRLSQEHFKPRRGVRLSALLSIGRLVAHRWTGARVGKRKEETFLLFVAVMLRESVSLVELLRTFFPPPSPRSLLTSIGVGGRAHTPIPSYCIILTPPPIINSRAISTVQNAQNLLYLY